MKSLVLPLAMALAGVGIGGGAAFALRPAPEAKAPDERAEAHGDGAAEAEAEAHDGHEDAAEDGASDDHGAGQGDEHDDGLEDGYGGAETAYHKIESQFVIPVIEGGRTRQLVVLSLALDIAPGAEEDVIREEPRLRDALLRVLFDHANTGGFAGAFTDVERMEVLRRAMLERAHGVVGPLVTDVLVLNVARQET
jgi:hypothetical protein